MRETPYTFPEPLETLLYQRVQLIAGRRAAQMFPHGTEELPLPPGFARYENESGDVFHYNRERIAPGAFVYLQGKENLFLNLGPYSKQDIADICFLTSDPTLCVVERTPRGIEVRCAVGTKTTLEKQCKYFEKTKEPGNLISIEEPEHVVVRRYKRGLYRPDNVPKLEETTMTTDTSKITGAANRLGDAMKQGGEAAKDLGTQIATTITSLDSRIAALEAAPPDQGGGGGPPPDQGGSGPTGGRITKFDGNNGGQNTIGGAGYYSHTHRGSEGYAKKKIDDYTIRYEIHQGDSCWGNDSDVSHLQSDNHFRDGTDIKVAFRIMIEPGQPNGAGWFVCGFENHNDDGQSGYSTSPMVVLELLGEKFSPVIRHGSSQGNTKLIRPWTMPQNVVRGQWYVWEIEFKSSQNNGYAKFKLDGQQVVNYTGPVGYGCDGYGMFGFYRATRPEVFAAQLKNITTSWGN